MSHGGEPGRKQQARRGTVRKTGRTAKAPQRGLSPSPSRRKDRVREAALYVISPDGQMDEAGLHSAFAILAHDQADMIAIGRRLMFNPRWAWNAASELGVFLKYSARYRNAHPRIGQEMDFPESAEKRRRLLEVMREEERVSQARN